MLNETAAIASINNLYSRLNSIAPSRIATSILVADNSRATLNLGQGHRRRRRRRRSRSRGYISTSSSRSSSTINTPFNEDSDEDPINNCEKYGTKRSTILRKYNKRLNLYTSLYYLEIIAKYSLGTNLNVLTSKSIYRIFKDIIYKTNYRNPERDLLQRINFEITIRFLLIGSVLETEQPLISQL